MQASRKLKDSRELARRGIHRRSVASAKAGREIGFQGLMTAWQQCRSESDLWKAPSVGKSWCSIELTLKEEVGTEVAANGIVLRNGEGRELNVEVPS